MVTNVSIVIPVLNAAETLGVQLDALLPQISGHSEIIVVDNGSMDTTPDLIAEYVEKYPNEIRSSTEFQRGANFARNHGIDLARHEKILLCDADDRVHQRWVSGLTSKLEDWDLVGGSIRFALYEKPWQAVHTAPMMFGFASPWGGSCGLRRSTWERVGGFDTSLKGRWEETDFFIRAQLHGHSLSWCEDAVVDYLIQESDAQSNLAIFKNSFNASATYWYGRRFGFSHNRRMFRQLLSIIRDIPLTAISSKRRRKITLTSLSLLGRLFGDFRFLPRALSREKLVK